MFEHDLSLTGKHARYMKYLVNDAKLYKRYIDVYMNGAVFGLLHDRRAERDNESVPPANILADVLQKERGNCVLLYRLVMLLDESRGISSQERIDRAFRDDADDAASEKLKANMELFHSYVRGGIEEIFEQFVEGRGTTPDEYLDRAMEVMGDFRSELKGDDFTDRLNSLMLG